MRRLTEIRLRVCGDQVEVTEIRLRVCGDQVEVTEIRLTEIRLR
jgi:hypothetical protein